jgi:hypothetical protein
MRRRQIMMVVTVAAVVGGGSLAGRGPASAGEIRLPASWVAASGDWPATAGEMPLSAALTGGGDGMLNSVSCASAGNCAAGGQYQNRSGTQAFVVAERNGHWGRAIEVPGTSALNEGANALVTAVSCPSAGNCAAGGYYRDGSGHLQAFVVRQVKGAWRTAVEVPGTAALNAGGYAKIASLSCASVGNCAAGGLYLDHSGQGQAFVVSEMNGSWGTAEEVPGSGALNAAGPAGVETVSCASAGNCAAGGSYSDNSSHGQAFVVMETNGTWGTAEELPGSGALNAGGFAQVFSLSCPSAGNCAAGGYYSDASRSTQPFVASEKNGTWGMARSVPPRAAATAVVLSVSCASAGNCAAGGGYRVLSHLGHLQAFVVREKNGTWGTAIEVPGTSSLNRRGFAAVTSVSCASAGNCAAGGQYRSIFSQYQAFVVSEKNGRWSNAIEVPGSGALNTDGSAEVKSVSCASAGNCAAAGYYFSGTERSFVVSKTHGTWGKAITVPVPAH